MLYKLKIVDLKPAQSSQTWCMFKDGSTGEWLAGPRHDVVVGKCYLVEINKGLNKDDSRLITRFIGETAG